MVDYAFQTQYRKEHIAAFEQNYSVLRTGCVQEAVIKGNTATFLVSGSGGATAVTRGTNGLIPYNTVSNVQNACTLVEYHAPFERTGFNIFASQGDQKRIMLDGSIATLNRNIDSVIITELDTATNDTGTATQMSLNLFIMAKVILGNNEVDTTQEDKMFAVITPAAEGYLMQIPEYASADFVEVKPFVGPAKRMRRWCGFNIMVHPNLTGNDSATEYCYAWHQEAMGHAANSKEMEVEVGYDGKQQLSWSRATLYHGAVLMQNSGIVQIKHDGSAFTAS